jgi:hypothetical protein
MSHYFSDLGNDRVSLKRFLDEIQRSLLDGADTVGISVCPEIMKTGAG